MEGVAQGEPAPGPETRGLLGDRRVDGLDADPLRVGQEAAVARRQGAVPPPERRLEELGPRDGRHRGHETGPASPLEEKLHPLPPLSIPLDEVDEAIGVEEEGTPAEVELVE